MTRERERRRRTGFRCKCVGGVHEGAIRSTIKYNHRHNSLCEHAECVCGGAMRVCLSWRIFVRRGARNSRDRDAQPIFNDVPTKRHKDREIMYTKSYFSDNAPQVYCSAGAVALSRAAATFATTKLSPDPQYAFNLCSSLRKIQEFELLWFSLLDKRTLYSVKRV